jgi:hypothetical protein
MAKEKSSQISMDDFMDVVRECSTDKEIAEKLDRSVQSVRDRLERYSKIKHYKEDVAKIEITPARKRRRNLLVGVEDTMNILRSHAGQENIPLNGFIEEVKKLAKEKVEEEEKKQIAG